MSTGSMVIITEDENSNGTNAIDNASNVTDAVEYTQSRTRGIQLEEAIVVFIVVGLWVCAVVLFIKQWDNIRILQPQEPRFKHVFKNLDTIRIVKKPQDSVIYKSYGRMMSVTMVAREKKMLLRMNTVPIKQNVQNLLKFQHTLPIIEMEDTEGAEGGSNV